jgi:hypothetical protein
MPKSTRKPASADQPANQRGKSRFGASGRPARVVLPERPPRAVDNEIVSILLGADPTALATQAEGVKSDAPAVPAAVTPALIPVEAPATPATDSGDARSEAKLAPAGDPEATADPRQGASAVHTIVGATEVIVDAGTPGPAHVAPLPAPAEVTTPPAARPRPASPAPVARRASEGATPVVQETVTREGAISSFDEFAERWKHGLRKGQLKICEVLYQKTYAVGRTECVTSFSELGRLSGLKMRQCFNIIAQLEALGFVERSRSESTSNKKDQGSVIRFHLYPAQ